MQGGPIREEWVWLLGLLALNTFIAFTHQMTADLLIRISPAKLIHLPIGVVVGLIPALAVFAFWKQTGTYFTFWWDGEIGILVPFLLKVILVELWFRTLPLEFANQQWGGLVAALVVSLIYLLMLHLELVMTGEPIALVHFLMCFSLCLLFLGYKSFWLSFGAQISFTFLPAFVYFEGSTNVFVYQPMYVLFVTFMAAILSLLTWKKFYL